MLLASECSRLEDNGVAVRRLAAGSVCYVMYPRADSRQTRTWYDARNKCLHLRGDLATMNVPGAALNWLEKNRWYWIGLQRDPFMMTLPGRFQHTRRILCLCFILL